jgi:hypothetical protein
MCGPRVELKCGLRVELRCGLRDELGLIADESFVAFFSHLICFFFAWRRVIHRGAKRQPVLVYTVYDTEANIVPY